MAWLLASQAACGPVRLSCHLGTSWMDVSVSYDLTEQLTLRADVANLQDKIDTRYLGSAEHIQYAATFGRRFTVGVRASF